MVKVGLSLGRYLVLELCLWLAGLSLVLVFRLVLELGDRCYGLY